MKTTDYAKFKFVKTNRTIRPGLVVRLKESIMKIGYVEGRPILVNERFEILDGQNRFMACKELEIPVTYSVIHTNGRHSDEEIIAELNKNQETWRLNDFIHHFAQQNVKYHTTIREFEERHKLGISASIMLCSKSEGSTSKAVREGLDLPLNSKREACAEFITSCSDLPFYRNLKFIQAVKALHNKGTKEHIEKLHKHRMQIARQPTAGVYCVVFANIINKHRPDASRINF